MHFKENTDVVTSDMHKIGHLDRVVVDPKTEEVTHLIIKKGFLFKEDRVVLAKFVDTTTNDMIVLKKESPDPDTYPLFEETEFVPVGSFEDFRDKASQDARKLLWYQTAVRLPGEHQRSYPAHSDKELFRETKRRNIPDNTVPLKEGASVTDSAGNKLGKIKDVFTEPEKLRVTHILVSSGLIKRDLKLIPVNWIKEISEDSVQLFIEKGTFENLADADTVMNR